jgi:hypothetical protein
MEDKLDKIIECLNGNGKIGIITRLTLLEEAKKTFEINEDKNENRIWKILTPVIPYVLFGAIFGVIQAVQHMFK